MRNYFNSHYRREARPALDESGKYGNYAPQQFKIITNVDINDHHSIIGWKKPIIRGDGRI